MSKAIIILESPNKVKAVQRFLGDDYKVIASGGHIKDLPTRSLGIDIERDFTPQYVSIPKKTKEIAEIKRAAQESDTIYLATDPDREGEAIAFHIAEVLQASKGKRKLNIFRIRPNEINKAAFLKELQNPSQINEKLCDSQQARRVLDRLVGYKISPILWEKVKRGLSAGRVQSVAVRLIVDREQAIRNHVKKPFWRIEAQLENADAQPFKATLHANGKQSLYSDASSVEKHYPKGVIKSEDEAKALVTQSLSAPFVVEEIKEKQLSSAPPPPFTTAELLKVASNRLGFSAKSTATLAQKLFESVQLAEGPTGIITYIRTDSVRVSDEAIEACRACINANYGNQYLPKSPIHHEQSKNKAKDNKCVQDGHEAIRPTDVNRTPESIKDQLSTDQFKLYQLIWRRFVASQMKPALSSTTTIKIANGTLSYRVSGSVPVFDGYKRVMDDSYDSVPADDLVAQLPKVQKGETLNCRGIQSQELSTQPPKRFTEGAFVAELERQGIGRPSTITPTISTIQSKGYVSKDKNVFAPTELGELVTELLVKSFPDIMDVHFTAEMENKLDRIEMGDEKWTQTLADFYTPFSHTLAAASQSMRNIKAEAEETNLDCERCGGKLVIKWGKNGHFLACKNYPACKNTMEFSRQNDGSILPHKRVPEVAGTCPSCGKNLVIKNGRYGRFLACIGYPDCKHTEALTLNVPCPRADCGGKLMQKRSKRGRIFYGCNRYPNCDYVSWNAPSQHPCPLCHHCHLEIASRNAETKLLCPLCGFSQNADAEGELQ